MRALVGESTARLLGRVGRADSIRLERHLQEVRELELQIENGALGASEARQIPGAPGEDPPIGTNAANSNDDVLGAALSAMRAVGYDGNFGDHSEGIPGLVG